MIYVIYPDVLNYQSFVIDSKEARRKLGEETLFHFDQRPKEYAQDWQALEIKFANMANGKNTKLPDITLRNGRLFLNEKAYAVLHDAMQPHGEFLPVTYDGHKGYIFNVLALADTLDGVDQKLSTKNEYGDLQSLAFHETRIKDMDLFRTEFDSYMGVYCQASLKGLIESAGLTGVTFGTDLGNIFPPDPAAQEPVAH